MLQDDIQSEFFISYIHKFVKEWIDLDVDDLIIQNTVGITNKTYIIKQKLFPNIKPEMIIFKHYGQTCEGTFLDRTRELQIVEKLAYLSIGPKYYGATERVRLEEYIESRVLRQPEMRDPYYSRKVALQLGRFHAIDMNVSLVNKSPMCINFLDPSQPILINIREKLSNVELFDPQEMKMLEDLRGWFKESEIYFVRSNLPQLEHKVCFSHNDLLVNNILVKQDSVVFIDFEYCGYNYQTFDIANYFNESQYDYDYPHDPYFLKEDGIIDPKEMEEFINVYILSRMGVYESNSDINDLIQSLSQSQINQYLKMQGEIQEDMSISILMSHLYWGGWAIHMSHSSEIKFDYLKFSYARYLSYMEEKKKWLFK